MKNLPKKRIIPVIILLIIGMSLYFYFHGQNRSITLKGEVEGTTYSQIADTPGKIIEMNAQLGSPVKAGDLIARLDDTDQRYALERLQITLVKRKLIMQNLLNGVRHEELEMARNDIRIAESSFRSAEAAYKQAQDDVEPLVQMWEIGGIARNEVDRAKLRESTAAEALEAARAQLLKAREHFSLLQRGADSEAIALAENDILEVENSIRQMQETLNKYEIRANRSGIIISINYNLGSIVNAGYNLADISADSEKYVVCYLPTEYSTQISYGQFIMIRSGKDECQAEVRFIDVKSQYTPKDMQTSSMKNKISVKVKLLLPTNTMLKPTNKVEVVFS
jgi:HlyD family secretion protein